MEDEVSTGKQQLRHRLLQWRRDVSARTRADMSQAICAHLMGWSAFQRAHAVVAYTPLGAEADPTHAVENARAAGISIFVPNWQDGAIEFVDDKSTRSPDTERSDLLMLVPGVAFDLRGARLGRGEGWYDRALSRFAGAVRAGIAFEGQILQRLPEEPWDVPMHFLVTERRVLAVNERSDVMEGHQR